MNSRWGAQVAAYTDEDEMDSDDKDDELIDFRHFSGNFGGHI